MTRISLLLLCATVAALVAAPARAFDDPLDDGLLEVSKTDPQGAFQQWKVACDKTFETQQAEAEAFNIWQRRAQVALENNANPQSTYRAGLSCMSDKPLPPPFPFGPEQSLGDLLSGNSSSGRRLLQAKQKGLKKPGNPTYNSKLRNSGFKEGECPEALDWRDLGAIPEVKDQGQCGSCWTFSATGAVEGAAAIATGTLTTLSEQQLVDCVSGGISDGCNGGWMDEAFTYVAKNGGQASAAAYPYRGSKGSCSFDPATAAVQLTGYTDVGTGDEGALLKAVCNQPVAIALEVNDAFMNYRGGIFSDASCGPNINHAVLVVGYGTDGGTPYWLVRNSWSAGWGESGYIRIKRGSNTCGLVTYSPTFPTISGATPPGPDPQPPIPDPQPPEPVDGCPPQYTVVSGDNMFAIAQKFKVNFLTLLAANTQLTDPALIFPGQVINIPCPPKLNCRETVTVQSGDWLDKIAQSKGVSLNDLLAVNTHFVNPDMIYPGDPVNIPPCSSAESVVSKRLRDSRARCRSMSYTAKIGDFVAKVAATHNLNPGDVLKANPTLQKVKGMKLTPGRVYNLKNCPKATVASETKPTACASMYVVASTDTVKSIADKLKKTPAKLMVANPFLPRDSSQSLSKFAKRKICVPV